MQKCSRSDLVEVIYKDVVIIGNGPSGICLSYMLAGNWPYYTGEPHPTDDMLTARLRFCYGISKERGDAPDEDAANTDLTANIKQHQCGKSNAGRTRENSLAHGTRYKLECLSAGVEGRGSVRPISLLMDQLQHPSVDAGLDVPSLLKWWPAEGDPEHRVIDHVVLGKDQPGGSWQYMDPDVLTLSLSRWMSLPDLDLRDWEKLVQAEQLERSASAADKNAQQETLSVHKTSSRVPVGSVAAYYKDYVRRKGLTQYFRCGTTVTSIKSRECKRGYNWIVNVNDNNGKRSQYRCRKVVLATGTSDLSNRLGVPGEDSHPDWVMHNLKDLETRLLSLTDKQGEKPSDEDMRPVLVVGAGLSAADAIIAARCRNIPVLHAFRSSPLDWDKARAERVTTSYDRLQSLPDSVYPEYHKVYEMMADGGINYPLYQSLPGYILVSFSKDDSDNNSGGTVVLSDPDGRLHAFQVSLAVILIGYKPDLSFLKNNGVGLGHRDDKPIDGKSNPIEVDNYTYEVIKAPTKGLYAIGPLVGDNFVRFILGGAFVILLNILNTIQRSDGHSHKPIVS